MVGEAGLAPSPTAAVPLRVLPERSAELVTLVAARVERRTEAEQPKTSPLRLAVPLPAFTTGRPGNRDQRRSHHAATAKRCVASCASCQSLFVGGLGDSVPQPVGGGGQLDVARFRPNPVHGFTSSGLVWSVPSVAVPVHSVDDSDAVTPPGLPELKTIRSAGLVVQACQDIPSSWSAGARRGMTTNEWSPR
jgi:hypothetical protein